MHIVRGTREPSYHCGVKLQWYIGASWAYRVTLETWGFSSMHQLEIGISYRGTVNYDIPRFDFMFILILILPRSILSTRTASPNKDTGSRECFKNS